MQTQDTPTESFLDLGLKLWPWLEKNKNALIGALGAVIVASAVWYYVVSQRAQNEIDAGQALTALLVSPTARDSSQLAGALEVVAAKYAGTAAGQRAQLQAAGALFDAGNYAEAQAQFQKSLNADPTGQFAATAELGIAASLEAQNQTDQAAAAYQRVISAFPTSTCVGQADFALGRLAEQQNKLSEAMDYYQKAMSAGLAGSSRNEVMMRASEVRDKLAATAPKPAATTAPASMFTPAVAPRPSALVPTSAPAKP